MLDWLRAQPLMISGEKHVMVHAGILPQWSIAKAETLAREAEAELKGKKPKILLENVRQQTDRVERPPQGYDRLRMIVNVFTRMRALTLKNELDYDYKSTLDQMPPSLRPWFKAPDRKHLSHTIVFWPLVFAGLYELRPHHLASIPARFGAAN